MLKALKNVYYLIKFGSSLLKAHNVHGSYHKRARKHCAALLKSALDINDGSVPDKVFRKTQWYMASNYFMGKMLAHLFKERIDPEKEHLLFNMGALIGLTDCLFDDFNYDGAAIKKMIRPGFQAQNAIEEIFTLYYEHFVGMLDEKQKKRIMAITEKGIYYQAESLKQRHTSLNEEAILNITHHKGGISIIMCALLFDNYSDNYESALYKAGGFIQLMNDAQDIHKDAVEGISTFMAYKKSFDEAILFLEAEKKQCFLEFKTLTALKAVRKDYFLFCLHTLFGGIKYKLNAYKENLQNTYQFTDIAKADKKNFIINTADTKALKAIGSEALRYSRY